MFFDGNDIGIDLAFFDKNAFDTMDKYNFQNSYNTQKYYDVNEGFLKGNMFVKEYKKLRKEYASMYGPIALMQDKYENYEWLKNPWPWEKIGGDMYV